MKKDILFSELQDIEREDGFDLSKNTTYGLGGKCISAFFPKTEEDAVRVYKTLKKNGERFFVLGKGSNILVSDKFYDGFIISTAKLRGIRRVNEKLICCLSGTTVAEILNFCKKEGLSGLEFLAGIPASIGGLISMNGGADGKFISDVAHSVALFDDELHYYLKKQCCFNYKHSIMRDINCIILSALFETKQTSPQAVEEKINYYLKKRSKQPKGKSCGCVFKNPYGLSAGKLIEDCGLKGTNFGGAMVSVIHANFILNGGCSSRDIYNLIKYVKETVKIKTGVLLDEEVVYIGDFQ